MLYLYHREQFTDIILKDRKNLFINNNMSLCESIALILFMITKQKNLNVKCLIKIKFPLISEIILDKDKLVNKNHMPANSFSSVGKNITKIQTKRKIVTA